jgi:hypothetical protein
MDQAMDSVERAFKESTLQDLLDEPTESKPLRESEPQRTQMTLSAARKK